MEDEDVCKKADIYTRVTDAIVRAIELGVSSCEMPWHKPAGAGLPRNPVTGNVYHGVNTVALWAEGRIHGYALPYWATYRQWLALGAHVRKGEHGSVVVFYKRHEKDEVEDDETAKQDRPKFLLRHSTVFNGEQVEDWSNHAAEQRSDIGLLDQVETFVRALAADIHYGSDSAYYSPAFDRICMPNRGSFVDTTSRNAMEGFYAVLLHEHIHWSGNEKRLKRDLSGRFGSDAYAMEELVAELGAAFLCATLGISSQPRPDHAKYIATWLDVLRQNKRAIFTAASAASVASRFLDELFVQNNAGVYPP